MSEIYMCFIPCVYQKKKKKRLEIAQDVVLGFPAIYDIDTAQDLTEA